jgi:hypothetical protein
VRRTPPLSLLLTGAFHLSKAPIQGSAQPTRYDVLLLAQNLYDLLLVMPDGLLLQFAAIPRMQVICLSLHIDRAIS